MPLILEAMYGQVRQREWMVVILISLSTTSLICASPIPEDSICAHHFNHKVLKCMRPFLDLYQSHHKAQKDGLGNDDLITKHLCFEYEKTLQCLHSALSSCPTLKNIQRVQHKLSADWVTDVNQLCRIQSEASNEDDNETEDSEEMDYLVNTTDESEIKVTNSRKTDTILSEHQHDVQENSISKKSNDPLWSRVIQVRQLKHSRTSSDSRNDNVEYKIYNIITNYSSSAIQLASVSVTLWMLTAIIYLLVL